MQIMKVLALLLGALALAGAGSATALAADEFPARPILVAQGDDESDDEGDDSEGMGEDEGSTSSGGGVEGNPDVVPDTDDMDAAEAEIRRQLRDARMNVIRRGNLLVVSMGADILFSFDSYAVSNEGTAAARALARVLNRHRRTTVEVNGHTDTRGSHAYNDTLSDNRARAVAQILVATGVTPSRITANGYGEERLAVQTPDETKEIRNRRVEIVIHGLKPRPHHRRPHRRGHRG
jgi:outer membrane protein OmpA-like peptidoglycan-associated protein